MTFNRSAIDFSTFIDIVNLAATINISVIRYCLQYNVAKLLYVRKLNQGSLGKRII